MKTTYSNLQQEISPDVYYKAATRMVANANEFYVAAKTPTLLIFQEQKGLWRKKYTHKAMNKIFSGLKTVYLSSLPETKQMLLTMDKKTLEKTLQLWEKYLSLPNFRMGFINNSNFKSMIMDENFAVYAIKDKETGKSVGIRVEENLIASKQFKKLEKEADYDVKKIISELKGQSGRKKF
ncbi:hypothetical protein HUU53_00790 [Candidatus Micrarchaeota archaeon]|nr:hypothetical protein [Candidatus Micrarchaeota archaeon]